MQNRNSDIWRSRHREKIKVATQDLSGREEEWEYVMGNVFHALARATKDHAKKYNVDDLDVKVKLLSTEAAPDAE